jgi:hypothetical protein
VLNRAGYSNPQVYELRDRARTVSDIKARRAAYDGVWQQVSKFLPIMNGAEHCQCQQECDRLHSARQRVTAPAGHASGTKAQ